MQPTRAIVSEHNSFNKMQKIYIVRLYDNVQPTMYNLQYTMYIVNYNLYPWVSLRNNIEKYYNKLIIYNTRLLIYNVDHHNHILNRTS